MSDSVVRLDDHGVTIDDEWISLVFGQELGHAWLAFAYANLGEPDPSKIMLGRSEDECERRGGTPIVDRTYQVRCVDLPGAGE